MILKTASLLNDCKTVHNKNHEKFKGKGDFNQVIDLLAGLNSNPLLLAVEEIGLSCDQKDRKVMEIDMVVSTLIKK